MRILELSAVKMRDILNQAPLHGKTIYCLLCRWPTFNITIHVQNSEKNPNMCVICFKLFLNHILNRGEKRFYIMPLHHKQEYRAQSE